MVASAGAAKVKPKTACLKDLGPEKEGFGV